MLVLRPEILKQEIKVFFVKYNDPIYVKLEKLDIMIRLASQANIAQVRATHAPELHHVSYFAAQWNSPCVCVCVWGRCTYSRATLTD